VHHMEEGIWPQLPLSLQDWANPILVEPFLLENGHLLIPDRPGNSIEWDGTRLSAIGSTSEDQRPFTRPSAAAALSYA